MKQINISLPYDIGDTLPKNGGGYYTIKGIHIYCGKNGCLSARYYVGNNTFITIEL